MMLLYVYGGSDTLKGAQAVLSEYFHRDACRLANKKEYPSTPGEVIVSHSQIAISKN